MLLNFAFGVLLGVIYNHTKSQLSVEDLKVLHIISATLSLTVILHNVTVMIPILFRWYLMNICVWLVASASHFTEKGMTIHTFYLDFHHIFRICSPQGDLELISGFGVSGNNCYHGNAFNFWLLNLCGCSTA